MNHQLWTFGYGRYASKVRIQKLLALFRSNRITDLVDIRHDPCASQLDPKSNYGPRPFHIQATGGFVAELESVGIRYIWEPRLGNPQKRDPDMAIMRAHLADSDTAWPVNLGLIWLAEQIKKASPDQRYGILCACGVYDKCHRKLVAETLNERHFGSELKIHCPR